MRMKLSWCAAGIGLEASVTIVDGHMVALDTTQKLIQLADGSQLTYDLLLVTTGLQVTTGHVLSQCYLHLCSTLGGIHGVPQVHYKGRQGDYYVMVMENLLYKFTIFIYMLEYSNYYFSHISFDMLKI